jgi:hypothetical protein
MIVFFGISHKTARVSEIDWEPVAALCHRVLDRLEQITQATTARIRDDLADYALVPSDEHADAVREQQRRRLEAFAERRSWSDTDLEQAVELAQRRARQGIAVDVLISAYHVGDRVLWQELCTEADTDAEAALLLPEVASLMLASMQAISTTLASAHSLETRAQEGLAITLSQRLIDLLWTQSVNPETTRLANFLGFVEAEPYEAIVWRPDDGTQSTSTQVPRLLQKLPGRICYAQSSSDFVFLAQGTVPDGLISLTTHLAQDGRIGVGSGHAGIGGAARSVEEARLALTYATDGVSIARFDEDWFGACLTSRVELIDSVVSRAREAARANDGLRATVVGFAAADMSIAQTARTMHLHANTVTYRLDRWLALTGWDPRSFEGLTKSVVACVLADRGDEDAQNTVPVT